MKRKQTHWETQPRRAHIEVQRFDESIEGLYKVVAYVNHKLVYQDFFTDGRRALTFAERFHDKLVKKYS